MSWDTQFLNLFRRCLTQYQGGDHNFQNYYSDEDLSFMALIGYKPRELFDFVEDLAEDGEPSEATALLVAAVRRDYLAAVQKGRLSSKEITRDELPTFGDELDGIAYLPRILAKARAKLRGELDPDMMYGCGGDRKFLCNHGEIHPADFLRRVWAAGENDQKVADYVKESTHSALSANFHGNE